MYHFDINLHCLTATSTKEANDATNTFIRALDAREPYGLSGRALRRGGFERTFRASIRAASVTECWQRFAQAVGAVPDVKLTQVRVVEDE